MCRLVITLETVCLSEAEQTFLPVLRAEAKQLEREEQQRPGISPSYR